MNDRTGQPNCTATLTMLQGLASVGARAFDVTLLDIDGNEQGFQRNHSLEKLRHSIGQRLKTAVKLRHSIVIDPKEAATRNQSGMRW